MGRAKVKARKVVLLACVLPVVAACSDNGSKDATPAGSGSDAAARTTVRSSDPVKADAVRKVVQDQMGARHLRSVIVRVTVDGEQIITEAFGESMTGVPATTDMHFRNGAVAISYVSTLLLQLVDEKKVSLDDKISKWVPEIPHSDEVTLGQLAQMTSGYVDFVIGNDEVEALLTRTPTASGQWRSSSPP